MMKRILLFVGDAVLFYAALFATLSLRYGDTLTRDIVNLHLVPMTIILVVWLIVFYIHNLYSLSFARNSVSFNNALFRAIGIGAVVAILYFYLAPQAAVTPKTNLFIHLVLVTVLLVAWRRIANKLVSRWERERVALIGQSDAMLDLQRLIVDRPHMGYDVAVTMPLEDVPHMDLAAIIEAEGVTTVIVDLAGYDDSDVVKTLFTLIPQSVAIERLPTFYESFAQRIPLNAIDHLWFLENISEHHQRSYETAKRVADISISILSGLVFAALFPVIALLIKLTSRGPIFYRQKRVGRRGAVFTMLKFRTMVENAEERGAQWARENDPRITTIGRFLRLTHLDELPQWWNILKGEMSTIGPRAERPEFHRQIGDVVPFYDERHLVRPGVTGWAQINYPYGASIEDAEAKLEYDLYYIKNRSPALDLSIVLKTIDLILTGRGR